MATLMVSCTDVDFSSVSHCFHSNLGGSGSFSNGLFSSFELQSSVLQSRGIGFLSVTSRNAEMQHT